MCVTLRCSVCVLFSAFVAILECKSVNTGSAGRLHRSRGEKTLEHQEPGVSVAGLFLLVCALKSRGSLSLSYQKVVIVPSNLLCRLLQFFATIVVGAAFVAAGLIIRS